MGAKYGEKQIYLGLFNPQEQCALFFTSTGEAGKEGWIQELDYRAVSFCICLWGSALGKKQRLSRQMPKVKSITRALD
jgi:hypothetical protein